LSVYFWHLTPALLTDEPVLPVNQRGDFASFPGSPPVQCCISPKQHGKSESASFDNGPFGFVTLG
jgi:hypothetical protein